MRPGNTLGRDRSFLFVSKLDSARSRCRAGSQEQQSLENIQLSKEKMIGNHHIIFLWIILPSQRPCSTVCRQVLSSHSQTEFIGLERFMEISAASTVQVTVLPVMALPHSVQLSGIWLLQSHLYLLTCFCSHLLIFLFSTGFNSSYPVKLMDRLGNHVLVKKDNRKSNILPGRF